MSDNKALATFGGGCFWCTEAIFQDVIGVDKVVSGYAGGQVENPTYYAVCNGTTGHAEVVQLSYDPEVISYEELLLIFFHTHDPTTLNRQGADVGTQYRSIVLYHDEIQREIAVRTKEVLNRSGTYRTPIVTEITPYERFYPAEDYHQDYFNNNRYQPYCMAVIDPKIRKFRKSFANKLKEMV
ncbi:MAG: peptide-methionine (S)-S-oxide reductase MsrA [Anaerolineae bacterium]|nr:peptide-methionine (S)-S-oxide reductase MsrA [Anaerolineae bacterium]